MLMTAPGPGQRVPLDTIDLYDPRRFQEYPQHVAFATLREEAPVWSQEAPNGARFWSVTRYADVVRVLKDVRRYSSEHGTILAVTGGDSAGGRTINLMDRPRHTWVRVPTFRTMTTNILHQRVDRVRAHVRRIIEPCFDGGEHDFAQLMFDLPMAAVGEILGIPERYWPDIPRWTMAGVAPDDEEFTKGETADTLRQAHHDLFAMFSELIEARRAEPKDDLVSMLVHLDFGGQPMEDSQILLNCYSFVMGATTTTPHTASHMMLALMERPDVWQALRDAPNRVGAAIQESLRWSTPTNHLMRRTTTDVEIAGTRIGAGELVVAWVASANRDEKVFHDPYSFTLGRSPNPHIAFGTGPHYCVGGPAARVALTVLLEELLARFDRFEPAGDAVHLRSNFINGLTRLPVTALPASGRGPAAAVGGAVGGAAAVTAAVAAKEGTR
ncbi:cytochrome P450 [Wenjunlia tyrosinilytica]|uniref:Cytochrome P450 n=1 Tax=Wenjunlia tyrosinilytica TaxID=1544741 RepID=A0A917ZUU7_9ACTN|nr:cytochrome P450 [Wenjunlia tyrosinilytica]GGO94218.1 cytochrome P450 [Wenjunlia tyrosinilytica]